MTYQMFMANIVIKLCNIFCSNKLFVVCVDFGIQSNKYQTSEEKILVFLLRFINIFLESSHF